MLFLLCSNLSVTILNMAINLQQGILIEVGGELGKYKTIPLENFNFFGSKFTEPDQFYCEI